MAAGRLAIPQRQSVGDAMAISWSGRGSDMPFRERLDPDRTLHAPIPTYCLRGFVTGQRRLGVITVIGVEVAEVHRDAPVQ